MLDNHSHNNKTQTIRPSTIRVQWRKEGIIRRDLRANDPLLVRKKQYRPRLFHSMESSSGALSSMKEAARRRKKKTLSSSDDVPAFLRKEEL
mmetsp:Transcript_22973/g.43390  ORF Transcript_22973/g.43390 Transcript_22973/m.43390 type:complete len:92 (-) Transcript_22973:122-397(-)